MNWISAIAVVAYEIIVILTIIHVLMDNRQPVKTMAWALVIYFVPVAGIILYLFFGINTRRNRLMSSRSLSQLTKRTMLEFVEQPNLVIPEQHRDIVNLFINSDFSLPFKGNNVDIKTDGYEFFLSFLADLGAAKNHIHIDIYIFEDDALGRLVRDVLIDKARHGVEIKIIYDDVGCWHVPRSFFERMREEGIDVVSFMPVRFPSFTSKVNYRNHRKMIIIDGKIGYIGGMNIALRYVKGTKEQGWRDTMLRIKGGVVYSLQKSFLVDWYFVDRTLYSERKYYPALDSVIDNNCLAQIVTSGPVTPYPEIMQGYVRILMNARRYVYIETPYFLPTESVLFALKTAALGGVDVRIIVPYNNDTHFVEWAGRSYLREVVKAGVKVYLYQSAFLHSKLLICDDSLCTCGSTNIDFRSFENNFEANAFFYDQDLSLRMKAVFQKDEAQSILYSSLAHRMLPGFGTRLLESIMRLLSPLL